jgi:hypothetical protein
MKRHLPLRGIAGVTVALFCLGGCQAVRRGDATTLPEPFAIELYKRTADRRYTYYEVEEDSLRFGGGRSARQRAARRVDELTHAELMELWTLVRDHDLLEQSGPLFGEGERRTYEVKLRAGGDHASYRAIDEEVPGLAELEERLFEMQAERRYRDVYAPIDEEVRRRKDLERSRKRHE